MFRTGNETPEELRRSREPEEEQRVASERNLVGKLGYKEPKEEKSGEQKRQGGCNLRFSSPDLSAAPPPPLDGASCEECCGGPLQKAPEGRGV